MSLAGLRGTGQGQPPGRDQVSCAGAGWSHAAAGPRRCLCALGCGDGSWGDANLRDGQESRTAQRERRTKTASVRPNVEPGTRDVRPYSLPRRIPHASVARSATRVGRLPIDRRAGSDPTIPTSGRGTASAWLLDGTGTRHAFGGRAIGTRGQSTPGGMGASPTWPRRPLGQPARPAASHPRLSRSGPGRRWPGACRRGSRPRPKPRPCAPGG